MPSDWAVGLCTVGVRSLSLRRQPNHPSQPRSIDRNSRTLHHCLEQRLNTLKLALEKQHWNMADIENDVTWEETMIPPLPATLNEEYNDSYGYRTAYKHSRESLVFREN